MDFCYIQAGILKSPYCIKQFLTFWQKVIPCFKEYSIMYYAWLYSLVIFLVLTTNYLPRRFLFCFCFVFVLLLEKREQVLGFISLEYFLSERIPLQRQYFPLLLSFTFTYKYVCVSLIFRQARFSHSRIQSYILLTILIFNHRQIHIARFLFIHSTYVATYECFCLFLFLNNQAALIAHLGQLLINSQGTALCNSTCFLIFCCVACHF